MDTRATLQRLNKFMTQIQEQIDIAPDEITRSIHSTCLSEVMASKRALEQLESIIIEIEALLDQYERTMYSDRLN